MFFELGQTVYVERALLFPQSSYKILHKCCGMSHQLPEDFGNRAKVLSYFQLILEFAMSIHMTQGIPISQYSTLLSAIPHHSNSAPHPAPPPNRLSLPQTVYVPKTSTASSRKISSVFFDMHGAPSGYGVPLPDILARGGGRGLEGFVAGVNEETFRDLKAGGVEKIQFRIVVCHIRV